MHNIQQLIEQAQSVMTCPECGRHYEAGEIKFKGFMDHTYILQTTCSNNHAPIFTTWITSYVPTLSDEVAPLQDDHVLALHKALEAFDGNFKALWSKER
jgi:hypothetical protein